MHSHSGLTTDKLPWTRQQANNILCIAPSQLPTNLHSYDLSSVIAMFNYGLSHFDTRGGGGEGKQSSSVSPTLSFSEGEAETAGINSDLIFRLFNLYFERRVTKLDTSKLKLNWVSAARVLVVVSMVTAGPTEHWRRVRHLAMLFIPHHSPRWC